MLNSQHFYYKQNVSGVIDIAFTFWSRKLSDWRNRETNDFFVYYSRQLVD